jgi:hypothetical protein
VRHVIILVAFPLLAATSKIVNFDQFRVGTAPPGWTVARNIHGAPSRWEVRQDQSAPTPPYVLAQVSNDPTDDRFPLALLDGVSLRDGDLSVRIKAVASREDQGGGLVWRYLDENNYYLLRANAMNKTVAVFRVQNGRRTAIVAGIKHEIPMNAWCILKVVARGSHFQVYVDHRRVVEGADEAFTGAGRVGVATVADSVMYFDDFRVTPR